MVCPEADSDSNEDEDESREVENKGDDNGNENVDGENEDDDDDDDDEDEDEIHEGQESITNPDAFYSPSALPAVLHVNQESRGIALKNYTSSFPTIYFNSSIDMLFFPAWCFQYHIDDFEASTSTGTKNSIQRIALENLVWYAEWSENSINNQIELSEFRNLSEFWLIWRRPDETGCGCRHRFNVHEQGEVSFLDAERNSERHLKDAGKAFEKIRKQDPKWKTPEVKFMRLMRNGALV